MSNIVGILLAAGSSRRFGSDKRLHPLADGTAMAVVSARNLARVCQRTIAVIRADDTALVTLLAAEGVETVVCHEAEQGMGRSLSAGAAASADAAGWLVALADMPYIQPATYQAVLAVLKNDASLVRPVYRGKVGHPVGFRANHLDQLLALTGDQGGKRIIDAHRDELRCCPVDDPGVLRDIDHPSQFMADNC